jgi:hypothetical protein
MHFACGQNTDRLILGRTQAEKILASALTDSSQHNVIDNKQELIKDSTTALEIVEPILFSTYGQKEIRRQRPYEIYHLDHYWLIMGTLPKDWLGGTFLIIVDARNSRIIRLTHGK